MAKNEEQTPIVNGGEPPTTADVPPAAFVPDKNLLMTERNPFGPASRKASGSERHGGMPGESGVAGQLSMRINDFSMLSIESPVSHAAVLRIDYAPRKYTISAETVSQYVKEYEMYVGTPEEAMEMMCRHFVEALEPMNINITTQWVAREGVEVNPTAQWLHPEFIRMQNRARQPQGAGLSLPPGVSAN